MPVDVGFILYLIFFLYFVLPYLIALIILLPPYKFPEHKKPRKKPLVSVIIPTKNEESVIEKTLQAVKKSTYRNIEIIVIDASSTDNTRNIARKYTRKIYTDEGKGKGAALNLAVKKTRGELLYFIDADSIIEKSAVEKIVSSFNGNAAAIGLALPENNKTLTAKIARVYTSFFLIYFPIISEKLVKSAPVIGNNLAIRKKILQEIGGFHNVLTEDINLGIRLRRNNYKVKYADARCYYQVPEKFSWFIRQQERWISGGIDEIIKAVKSVEKVHSFFVLMPVATILGYSPALAFLFLIAFITTNNIFFALTPTFIFLVFLVPTIRYLEPKDAILLPITFILFSFIQLVMLVHCAIKKFLGIKPKWYKTPKDRFNQMVVFPL
jgi:cellulose synthase/poly-beta-1,6-N-acetylglucosamine synthase-like glycosyltransferase